MRLGPDHRCPGACGDAHGGPGSHGKPSALLFAAEEIISPPYVNALKRLGAEIRVLNWLPRTKYTEEVAGGKDSFWGYSLNRLMCVGALRLLAEFGAAR